MLFLFMLLDPEEMKIRFEKLKLQVALELYRLHAILLPNRVDVILRLCLVR